jgi:hypothetical protein
MAKKGRVNPSSAEDRTPLAHARRRKRVVHSGGTKPAFR